MIKIAIIGSRNFNDYELFKEIVNKIISEITDSEITIVSGGAKGTDTLAERYAKENNYNLLIFKPNWKLYGKGAGIIRNKEIVKNSDIIIAFKSVNSKGTNNTIQIALKNGKKVYIYEIESKLLTIK